MMVKPGYKGGSIVNLVSSVQRACGGKSLYPPLRALSVKELQKYETILIILVDGLGDEYLKNQRSFLKKHRKGRMTSLFPSTTANCISRFMTGVPAQQHGIVAWHTYVKELGAIITPLPYVYRNGPGLTLHPEFLFQRPQKSKRTVIIINPEHYLTSVYNRWHNQGYKRYGYKDKSLAGFKNAILHTAHQKGKKYVFAYWPYFDTIEHLHSTKSKKTLVHFKKIDKAIETVTSKLKNTFVIVTADHGMIDTKMIHVKDHPKLQECLAMPFSGEPRAPFCYVRPGYKNQFVRYARTKLKKYCTLKSSEQVLKEGFFGIGKPHPKLKERIGDYMLFMKQGYILKDTLPGEHPYRLIANHGSLSNEEMWVPLIIIKT